MKKIIYLITAAVLCLPLLGLAQTVFDGAQVTAARESYDFNGGYVHDMAIGADATVYTCTNSPNGYFESSNQGVSWSGVDIGMDIGNCANVEVSDNSVFVIAGINLYRKQSSGWDTLSPEDVGNIMHYGQSRLFVEMRDGAINISSDDGDNFVEVAVDSSITDIIDIETSAITNEVYLIGKTADNESTIFYSSDNGSTWTNSGITMASTSASITVKPTDSNFIIQKYGNTIKYSSDGLSGPWTDLTSEYSGDVLLYGDAIFVGLNYTTDKGLTWNNLASTTTAGTRLKNESMVIDPLDHLRFYVETMAGVATSADAGATWTDVNEGIHGITVSDFSQSADKNTVWLACYGGLAKTDDFTATAPIWTFPITADSSIDFSTAVWVDPDNTNIVVAAMGTNIYYSGDSGATWNLSDANLSGGTVNNFYENLGSLFAANDTGVLISVDNGATWADFGLSGIPVNSLTADSSGNLYAGVGREFDTNTTTNKGIYKNDGTNWTQLTGVIEGYLINDVKVIDDKIFAAAGETSTGGVFRSIDSGATWEDLTANGLATDGWYHALANESTNTDIVYVSTARPAGTGYIYKSMDAGETWNLLYTGLKDETFNVLIFDGLVTGSNTGLYNMHSMAQLSLKPLKKTVNSGDTVNLNARLKDKATKTALKNKTIKIYKKYRKNGHWKFVKKAKTDSSGQVVFARKVNKKTFYQARWLPKKGNQRDSYGDTVYKSKRITLSVE